MNTNITTLAINLLVSERMGHRNVLAQQIIEVVEKSEDVLGIEKHLKSSFLSVIAKCVENPNCKSREDFYQLAQFYNQKIKGTDAKTKTAA